MCTHAEELNDWIRVFKIITNASRYKCSHYAYIIHIFFQIMNFENCYFELKIKHLLEGNIIKKSNVFSSKSLCRVLWISREFVKTKSAEEPSATIHIQMSVSYDIMCVIWSPSIALVPCACGRSDINGCAVTRAANDDIFLIWHHLHLVLRGCSTSEYLCSVLRHVLECLRAIFSSSINRSWMPPGGEGGTARHCHGARLYLHASIDISMCACIWTIGIHDVLCTKLMLNSDVTLLSMLHRQNIIR